MQRRLTFTIDEIAFEQLVELATHERRSARDQGAYVLETAEEQHRLLLQVQPGSLDDATVERVVRVFTEEVDLLAVYDEQLGRWRSGPMTGAQCREVERLSGQLAHNRDVDAAILTLAENLKATTIDAILAKSDLELGLDVFTNRSPLFPRDPSQHPQP